MQLSRVLKILIDLLIYSIKVTPHANMVHSCHQLDVLNVIYISVIAVLLELKLFAYCWPGHCY